MLRDFEIVELQADELYTFIGSKSRPMWLFATIEVCSRLWASSLVGRRSYRSTKAVLNDVMSLLLEANDRWRARQLFERLDGIQSWESFVLDVKGMNVHARSRSTRIRNAREIRPSESKQRCWVPRLCTLEGFGDDTHCRSGVDVSRLLPLSG